MSLSGGDAKSAQQYMGKGSMSRALKWPYLVGGILIVMSCLLGAVISYVVYQTLFHGMDPRGPLLFIILPLSVLILVPSMTLAVVLTRRK